MAACLLQGPTTLARVHLLAGYEDGTVAVWDTGLSADNGLPFEPHTAPPEPVMQLKAHGEPVMALHADPNGTGRVDHAHDTTPRLHAIQSSKSPSQHYMPTAMIG